MIVTNEDENYETLYSEYSNQGYPRFVIWNDLVWMQQNKGTSFVLIVKATDKMRTSFGKLVPGKYNHYQPDMLNEGQPE